MFLNRVLDRQQRHDQAGSASTAEAGSIPKGRGSIKSAKFGSTSPKKKAQQIPTLPNTELKKYNSSTSPNGPANKYTFDLTEGQSAIKAFYDFHAEEATYRKALQTLIMKLQTVIERETESIEACLRLHLVVETLQALIRDSNTLTSAVLDPENIGAFDTNGSKRLNEVFEGLAYTYRLYMQKYKDCCAAVDSFPKSTNVMTKIDLRNVVSELRRPLERVVEFRFFLRRVKRAQVSSSDVVFYDLCRALESINGVIAVICKELDVNDCFNDVEKFEDSLDCQNCAPLDQAKPNLPIITYLTKVNDLRSSIFMPCPEKITQTTFLDIQFTAKDGVKFSEKDMFIKLSKKRRLVELTLLSDDLVITGIVANGKRTLLYPPVPLECVELEDKNCKGGNNVELLECRLSRSVLLVLEPEGGKKDRFVDKFRAAKKRLAHTRRSGADSVRQSLDMTANSNQIPTTANDKHHLEIDELMLSEDGVTPRVLGWKDDDEINTPRPILRRICRPNKWTGTQWEKIARSYLVVYSSPCISWIALELDSTAVNVLQAAIQPSMRCSISQKQGNYFIDIVCSNRHGDLVRYLIMMKSEEDAVEAHGVISREIIYATQLLLRNLRRNKAIWNAENSSPQDFGNMAKSAEMKFSDGLICFNEVWTLLGPLDLCVFLANTTNEDGGYCLGRIAGISTLCPNHIVLHGSLEENTFRHEVEDNCLWISFGDSKNGSLYEYKLFFKGSITHFTSALDQELKKAPLVKDLIIEREQRIIREIELERLRGEEELQRNATEAALSLMEANTATAPIEASTVIDEKKEGADDGDGGVDDEMNDVNAYFDSLALDPADQGVEVQAISVLPEEDSMDLDDERKMVDMNGGSSNTLISSNIDLKMFAGREDEEEGKSASDEPVPSIPFEILDDLFDCLKKSGLSSESFPVFNSLFGILDQGSSNWSQCFNEEIEGYGGVAEGGLLRRSATDTTISSYLSNSDAGEASAGVKPGNNVSDARVSNLKKLVKLQKYYEEYRILLDKTSSMRGTVARNRRIYKE